MWAFALSVGGCWAFRRHRCAQLVLRRTHSGGPSPARSRAASASSLLFLSTVKLNTIKPSDILSCRPGSSIRPVFLGDCVDESRARLAGFNRTRVAGTLASGQSDLSPRPSATPLCRYVPQAASPGPEEAPRQSLARAHFDPQVQQSHARAGGNPTPRRGRLADGLRTTLAKPSCAKMERGEACKQNDKPASMLASTGCEHKRRTTAFRIGGVGGKPLWRRGQGAKHAFASSSSNRGHAGIETNVSHLARATNSTVEHV